MRGSPGASDAGYHSSKVAIPARGRATLNACFAAVMLPKECAGLGQGFEFGGQRRS
jgi:hypothetical protein